MLIPEEGAADRGEYCQAAKLVDNAALSAGTWRDFGHNSEQPTMGGAWTCGGKFCPCWHPSFLWRCSGQRSCMLCRNGAATVKRPPAPSAFCASRANCLCFSFRRQFAQQASSRPNCVGALQLCCLFTVRGFHRSEEHTSELQSQFHLVC